MGDFGWFCGSAIALAVAAGVCHILAQLHDLCRGLVLVFVSQFKCVYVEVGVGRCGPVNDGGQVWCGPGPGALSVHICAYWCLSSHSSLQS